MFLHVEYNSAIIFLITKHFCHPYIQCGMTHASRVIKSIQIQHCWQSQKET